LIRAIFVIIRPLNVLITMAAVYVGGLIAFDAYYAMPLLLASISAGLIAAFGNVVNDIFDIETDRLAKPFRPLPAQLLSVNAAIVIALALVAPGLALAALINPQCLLLASVAAIALLFYTPVYKGKGYYGNLLVSFISALAFFYGAAAVGHIDGGLVPAVFAFLFHLGRELVKDMEDVEADAAAGIGTGAVKYGLRATTVVAIAVLTLLIIATLAPYLTGAYGGLYLVVVLAGVDIFLVYCTFRLIFAPDRGTYRFIAGLMKLLMPLGLLAVLVGSRGY